MQKQEIFICLKEGAVVHAPQVHIQDVATIFCTDKKVAKKVNDLIILDFSKEPHTVQAITALYLMARIAAALPDAELTNLGETQLVVEWVTTAAHPLLNILKIAFVSLVLFFGGAFSMMSFHTDVGLRDTFARLYTQFTGMPKPAVTALDVGYSIGVCLGIVVFFNHIGKKKVTHDPTPIQVQMRQYEKNVEQTFLAASARKGRTKDVS